MSSDDETSTDENKSSSTESVDEDIDNVIVANDLPLYLTGTFQTG